MIRFEFNAKDLIVVTPELCLIDEFVDILKWDKTSDLKNASGLFRYVHYMCDMSSSNTYRDLPTGVKETTIMKAVYGVSKTKFTKKESELVDACLHAYFLLSDIPEERVLSTFDEKAEEVRQVLEETMPETVENDVSGIVMYASNTDIITKGLKELNKTKAAKIAIMQYVRQDNDKDKVRGKAELSPLAQGRIALPDFMDLLVDR